MYSIYFGSEKCLFVSFLISFYFLCTFSQPQDIAFKTKGCYKAIGDEDLSFETWGHFPENPLYYILKLTYTLIPAAPGVQKITESRIYHLKRVDEKCKSSFVLGTKGLNFKLMKLDMFAYLNFDKMAEFHYEMHNDYKFDIPMLIDTYNNFGISVKFSPGETEYVRASPRVSPEEIIKSVTLPRLDKLAICVINEFSRVVILTPKFDTGSVPTGLITRVFLDYTQRGEKLESVSYTAFSCHAPGIQRQSSRFVHQINGGFDVNFQAKYSGVGPMVDEKKQAFSVPHAPFFSIKWLKPEHKERKKIYFMVPEISEEKCGNFQRTIYKTKEGVPYFAKEYKKTKVRESAKRFSWVLKDPSESC